MKLTDGRPHEVVKPVVEDHRGEFAGYDVVRRLDQVGMAVTGFKAC